MFANTDGAHTVKDSATESKESAQQLERRSVPLDKLIYGIIALSGWILLFAAGLLIETIEYRLVLAPRSVAKQLGIEEMKSVPGQAADNSRASTSPQGGPSSQPRT